MRRVIGLVFALVLCGCPQPIQPVKPVSVPIGSSPEATGSRIVDVIHVDNTESGAIAAVASWLKVHPGYDVEALTPCWIIGGGDTNLRLGSYLVVASKEGE